MCIFETKFIFYKCCIGEVSIATVDENILWNNIEFFIFLLITSNTVFIYFFSPKSNDLKVCANNAVYLWMLW